jgi:hypothetical protein
MITTTTTKKNAIVSVYRVGPRTVQVEVREENEQYAGGCLLCAPLYNLPAERLGEILIGYQKDVRFADVAVNPLPDGLQLR